MIWDIPPPIYDYTPPSAIYEIVDAAKAEALCRSAGAAGNVIACAVKMRGTCFVIMPKIGPGGVGPRTGAVVKRHEDAHCNGWGADHPQR